MNIQIHIDKLLLITQSVLKSPLFTVGGLESESFQAIFHGFKMRQLNESHVSSCSNNP